MSIFTGDSLLGSVRVHLSKRAFQLRVVNDQPRISEEFAEPEKTLATERFCKRDATSFADGIRESTVDMTCAPQAPAVVSTNFPAPDALADRITSVHVDPRMMTGSFGKNSNNPLLNPDIPEITAPLHAVVNCIRVLFMVMRVFTEVMPSPAWVSGMHMPGISHRAQLRIDVVSARTAAINSATCLLVCHNAVWCRFTQAQRLLWAALPVIEPQTVARCMMTSISNQDVRVPNSWLLVLSELASVVDPFDEDIAGFYRWITGGIPSHFENQVLACKAKAYGLAVERHGALPLITQLQGMNMLNIGTLIIRDKNDKVISSKQSVSVRGDIMSAFVPLHFVDHTRRLIALLKDNMDLFQRTLCCEHDAVPTNDGTYAMTEFMLIAPPMMRWLCNQPVQSISDTLSGTVTQGHFPAMRRFLRAAAPLRCEGMWAYLTNAGAIPPSSFNVYIVNACSTASSAPFRPDADKVTKCFRIPVDKLSSPVINAHPVVTLFSKTPRWSDPVYKMHLLNGSTVDVPITTNRMAGTVTRSCRISPLLSEKMENTVWPDGVVDTRLVLMITSLTALMAKDTHGFLLNELTDEHYDLHPQFGNGNPQATMDKIPWVLPPEHDDIIIESEGHVTIFTRALIVLWCASAFKIRPRLRFFDSLQAMLAAHPTRLTSSWKCISAMGVETIRPSKLKMMIEALPAFLDTIDAGKTAINRDAATEWAARHTYHEPADADAGGGPLNLSSS